MSRYGTAAQKLQNAAAWIEASLAEIAGASHLLDAEADTLVPSTDKLGIGTVDALRNASRELSMLAAKVQMALDLRAAK